jgi:putative addiction module component (TIGR02574 family)
MQPRATIVESFRGMSIEDKLELLDALWDEVATDADTRPLDDAQRAFLDLRLAEVASSEGDEDWATVRDRLLR